MKQQDGKILVPGATGCHGGSMARQLVKNGFSDVHAQVRDTGRLRADYPRLKTFSEWLSQHREAIAPKR